MIYTSALRIAFSAVTSIAAVFQGAGCISPDPSLTAISADYESPVIVGKIESPELKESSGLSASECQDVLWTHNDAGNEALIYGMDLTGKHLGVWRVTGSSNTDWESIATVRDKEGKCHLLIADIGDNDEARPEAVIYRVPEPTATVETSGSSTAKPLETAKADTLRYTYPDGPKNAEAILAHPDTGDIYVVSKKKSGPAGVYRLKPEFGTSKPQTGEKVAEIRVPSNPEGRITGSSFSPDGKRMMLCDLKNGYEFVLPESAANPDAIWTQKPSVVDLGDRKQGEGVSYGRDGMTVYASSEKRDAPIYMVKRR